MEPGKHPQQAARPVPRLLLILQGRLRRHRQLQHQDRPAGVQHQRQASPPAACESRRKAWWQKREACCQHRRPSRRSVCLRRHLALQMLSDVKKGPEIAASACRLLGQVDTGGLNNYMATISRDGRWVAAGTFTSDVKVRGQGGRSTRLQRRPSLAGSSTQLGRQPAGQCPPAVCWALPWHLGPWHILCLSASAQARMGYLPSIVFHLAAFPACLSQSVMRLMPYCCHLLGQLRCTRWALTGGAPSPASRWP